MMIGLYLTLILALLVQAIFFFIFTVARKQQVKAVNTPDPSPFTVLICARNELPHLEAHLQTWLSQLSSRDHLMIVDDGSTDGSHDYLKAKAATHPNLTLLHIPDDQKTHPGKKAALHEGLKACKTEHIILTDADCYPLSEYWASSMNQSLHHYDVVIGFAPLIMRPSIVSMFASLESIYVAMQYGSFAILGRPYMYVGRNAGIKKSKVLQTNAINKHMDMTSGDDDLTFQAIRKDVSVGVNLQKKALVNSYPPEHLRTFIRQKTRHMSTSVRYDAFSKIALAVLAASHILFYFCLGLMLFSEAAIWVPSMLTLRAIIILPAWYRWSSDLLIPFRWGKILIFDLLLSIYYPVMMTTLFKKSIRWT